MKRLRLFFLTSVWLVGAVSAATNQSSLKPTLVLDHVTVVKAQEREGDELYFDIKINRPNHSATYMRVPNKPKHWSSHVINQIKAMPLWSGSLAEGESIALVLSLIESDDSPLNPDDLIGLVSVTLKNNQGRLQTKWRMPNQTDSAIKQMGKPGDLQTIDLMSGDAHYQVYLSVKK